MEWVSSIELALVVLLLGLSAFFSSSETSLFSLTQTQLEQMRRDGNPRAPLVTQLLREPRRLIVTILIGNELVNVSASALSAAMVLHWAGPGREWLNLVVMVPALLLFGEITPKTLAIQHNMAFAAVQAPWVERFAKAISPVRWLVRRVADVFITLVVGKERSRANLVTEDMVRSLARTAVVHGDLDATEATYIEHIFEFGDKTVRDVMTVRSRLVSLPVTSTLEQIVATVRRTRFQKFPVYEGESDAVVGVLFARDLLGIDFESLAPEQERATLAGLFRPAHCVSETLSAAALFHTFRQRRMSVAFAVDEYGGVTGLVTMSDLLECIFGEIPSRSLLATRESVRIEPLAGGRYRAEGSVTVSQLEEELGVRLPDDGSETIAGLLLHAVGELPAEGAVIALGGLEFTVERVEARRVAAVTIRSLAAEGAGGGREQEEGQ